MTYRLGDGYTPTTLIYQFATSNGDVVDLAYKMQDVPPIGTQILHNGEVLTRVCSRFEIDDAHNRSQFPYIGNSLPRNLAGAKCDAKGRVIVQSKRDEANIASRHNMVKT